MDVKLIVLLVIVCFIECNAIQSEENESINIVKNEENKPIITDETAASNAEVNGKSSDDSEQDNLPGESFSEEVGFGDRDGVSLGLSGDGNSGQFQRKFTFPNLNEDEEKSQFMPIRSILKCDGCKAIAFRMHAAFKRINERRKSLQYNLPESELIDLLEKLCRKSTWLSYGVKEVNGVNRLNGPGTYADNEAGTVQGGGQWPSRLSDMCEVYMGDVGEMEIYGAFRRDPSNLEQFTQFLCYETGDFAECSHIKDEL